MKALLVEDNLEKATRISDAILSVPGISRNDITHVDSVIEAKREMLASRFDLLILDIQLPSRSGERPKIDGGAALLQEIRLSKRYNLPVHVVGLTSFEDAETIASDVFAQNTSVIIRYDRASDGWQYKLLNRVEQIIEQERNTQTTTGTTDHIIVLIHGIRTHAPWAEMVTSVLETRMHVKVITIRYGFFDVVRLLCPVITRTAPIDRIVRELRDVRTDHPTAEISAIAHSFGTYALVQGLSERDIRLHRIIFCGSIVSSGFRRANFRGQIGPDPILNDCGTNDFWPVLAQSVTWGYGATGTFGFGTNGVRDRFNKFTHGDYFGRSFVDEFWVPYLRDGTIKPTSWENQRYAPPWWQSILIWIQIKYIVITIFVVAGLYGAWCLVYSQL